ncbi:MAG TPA: phytase, partial [Gemmatimonas sp.]|nr:phytase [Gemmatimonas sp.]
VTSAVPGDSDDPAIWIHLQNGALSRVLGTDKADTNGGIYNFDLEGGVDSTRSVAPLRRPNNVDVEQDILIDGTRLDIATATERNRQAFRIFALPDMTPIDDGGIRAFDGDTARAPMGIAIYKRARDHAVFVIVGGKSGPTDGTYLWQYRLGSNGRGGVSAVPVRRFGNYSGRKEIESILVDDASGYVYYSDEGTGVRKYHADPDSGNAELALFGTTDVFDDHEGLAVYATGAQSGYIIMSDQGANRIHLFTRDGSPGSPHVHRRVAIVPVAAVATDGLDATSRPLGPRFPHGMLVMMSNRGGFHLYDWRDVEAAIASVTR